MKKDTLTHEDLVFMRSTYEKRQLRNALNIFHRKPYAVLDKKEKEAEAHKSLKEKEIPR